MSTEAPTPTPAETATEHRPLAPATDFEALAKARGLDARSVRAVMQDMAVVPIANAPRTFRVYNARGDVYEVDLAYESCTCPDFERRMPAGGCKHVRRAALETGAETFDRREFVESAVDEVREIDEQIATLMKEREALSDMLAAYRDLDGRKAGGDE